MQSRETCGLRALQCAGYGTGSRSCRDYARIEMHSDSSDRKTVDLSTRKNRSAEKRALTCPQLYMHCRAPSASNDGRAVSNIPPVAMAYDTLALACRASSSMAPKRGALATPALHTPALSPGVAIHAWDFQRYVLWSKRPISGANSRDSRYPRRWIFRSEREMFRSTEQI